MTHPSPWQLELYALGEEVPEVLDHLPCAECEARVRRVTRDPGPVPLGILNAVRPQAPASTGVSGWTVAAGVAFLIGGMLASGAWWAVRPGDRAPTDPPVAGSRARPPERVPRGGGRETDLPADTDVRSEPDPPEGFASFGARVRVAREGHVLNPVWSPDGSALAFEVSAYGSWSGVFVREALGGATEVRLPGAAPDTVVFNPAWVAPRTLVVEGSSAGSAFRLYFTTLGGGVASELIQPSLAGDLTFPSWDPVGERVIFVDGAGDLAFYDATTGVEVLEVTPEWEAFPQIDRSGEQLLFTRKRANSTDVWSRSLETGDETRIAGGPGDQDRPTWVDGGIAYFDQDGDSWDLVVVQDGEAHTLAEGIRLPVRARPAVSPDGRWVAFTYDDPAAWGSVWLARVDGSARVEVPTGRLAVGEPAMTDTDGGLRLAYTGFETGGSDYRALYVQEVRLP